MIRRRVTMKTQTAASGGVGLGRGGRMSRQRKRDAVVRLLRGEDLEILSRALGVTAATLKENLLWVRTFDTVEELRQALLDFRESYNTTWLIERHGFQTPAAVRKNQLSTAARAA